MTPVGSFTLYFAFAVLATGANVLVQTLVFAILQGEGTIFLAMPAGALVALVLKYVLDRSFVFGVETPASSSEFARYALTGGAITAVFFAVEYAVWVTFGTPLARDIGIVLGMIVGYTLKYLLDRQFTFVQRDPG